MGNVPLEYGNEDVRAAFTDQGFPRPGHACLQHGGKSTQWTIVTMHSKRAADHVYNMAQKKWDAFVWEKGHYAVVRRAKGNIEWAPMVIILAGSP